MTTQSAQLELEAIVREVLRRLEAVSSNKPQAPSSAGELVLEGKVVTLESLRNRWEGVRSVVVSPKSIVTPSVVDELKERGIVLSRRSKESRPAAAAIEVVVTADAEQSPAAKQIENYFSAAAVKRASTQAAVEHFSKQTKPGLLITGRPYEAQILANREKTLRAAVACSAAEAAQAKAEANVNLLIVSAEEKNAIEILQAYVSGKALAAGSVSTGAGRTDG